MELSYFHHAQQDYSHEAKFNLTLNRIQACLQELESIHQQLPPTIHVAGTNGKCSTIAFMRSILEQAGLRVHVFTSPHLTKVNERIILAGQEISDQYFEELIQQLAPTLKKHELSWFESLTVIAFQAFHQVPADVLLLEVGLGGQFDATNVVTPIASVITPISYDHTADLGNTLTQIALAKAGIIKPNVPVFSAVQEPEVEKVLRETAQQNNAPLRIQNRDWSLNNVPSPQRLVGKHQLQNAALALNTLKNLPLFSISVKHTTAGIEKAYAPGRLMKLDNTQSLEIWFDGGHNPGAAVALKNFFNSNKSKPLYVICGLLKSKDAQAFIETLKPITDQFIFIPVPDHPFSYHPDELMQYYSNALVADDVLQALKLIKQPATILVCGSFYLAQAIL
jgi:dihydrofolate synthase/folylpolyglutamate synthase